MLPADDISIRKCGVNDIEALTDLHLRSFSAEDHIPVMLGENYVKAYYKWLITSPDTYVLGADCDHKIVGLVAVCDYSYSKAMFMACIKEFGVSVLKHPALLIKKKLWNRLLEKPPTANKVSTAIAKTRGIAQMTIGAVDANFRGKSIFPRLVEATKGFSKERGSRAIVAGLYGINKSSRAVFVKGNWREVPELQTSELIFFIAFLDPTIQEALFL